MGLRTWLSSSLLAWALFSTPILGGDVLKNEGFTECLQDSDIQIKALDVSFNRASQTAVLNAAGTSDKEHEVTVSVLISAYGQKFTKEFDPCDKDTKVDKFCPGK